MGVWSLLQYFERYAGGAVTGVSPFDISDSISPFDVVYVDANSVLHGGEGDVRRLITIMRLLKPRRGFILAADESTDAKADGQVKPGKYLTACRYFIAAAEYVRGGKHTETAAGEITDQEDYTSPLMLPQAEPNPFLKHAVAEIGTECLIAAVARDVKGTADCKVASLVHAMTAETGSCRHCVVSRDNDLILTALTAWQPHGETSSPPSVLTWPSQDWDQEGLLLLDTTVALPALLSRPPPADLRLTASYKALARDFSLLTYITLGCDFLQGIFGGVHYTHLHSLVQKYASLFEDGEGIVKEKACVMEGREDVKQPVIHRGNFVKLLKKFGASRGDASLFDTDKDAAKKVSQLAAKKWLSALWVSMAAIMNGRTPRQGEKYTQPVSANAVLSYLESPQYKDEVLEILQGTPFLQKDGASASKVNPNNRVILEIFSTNPENRHLHGQGEVVPAAKLPTRNQKCESLPPINSQRFDMYKVRLFADDVLRPFLHGKAAAPPRQAKKKVVQSGGASPRVFRGFSSGGLMKVRKPVEKEEAVAAPAASSAGASSEQIHSRMWDAMGLRSTTKATETQSKLILKGVQEEKRQRKVQRKTLKRKRAEEAGEDGEGQMVKRSRKSVEQAATEERKALRRAKSSAIAKKRMKPKNTSGRK